MFELYIEKKNTINQRFPLMYLVLRIQKRAGKVTVQDKGKSRKSETMKLEEFEARFAPATWKVGAGRSLPTGKTEKESQKKMSSEKLLETLREIKIKLLACEEEYKKIGCVEAFDHERFHDIRRTYTNIKDSLECLQFVKLPAPEVRKEPPETFSVRIPQYENGIIVSTNTKLMPVLPDVCIDHMRAKNTIKAIKAYREAFGGSLAECKYACEQGYQLWLGEIKRENIGLTAE